MVEISLRPDGMLVFDGEADEDASLSFGLLNGKSTAHDEPSVHWLRRLVGDHVRRLVAASGDGTMPQGAELESCRPDTLQALAILSSVPPMPGGEYWTADVLTDFLARVESSVSALAAKKGGDLLAAVSSFGPGWRDVGKVSLHLAENKGDKSGIRPFAFLATFVSRADAEGRARQASAAFRRAEGVCVEARRARPDSRAARSCGEGRQVPPRVA